MQHHHIQETGQVGTIRRAWFENPAINNGILIEAKPGQKSYEPELFKSRLKEPAADDAPAPKKAKDNTPEPTPEEV